MILTTRTHQIFEMDAKRFARGDCNDAGSVRVHSFGIVLHFPQRSPRLD